MSAPDSAPDTAPPLHAPLQHRRGWRHDGAQVAAIDDILAEEVPVALVYNGISHAVMMATPADLEDFALGFSLAEGIIERPGELRAVERADHGPGIELALTIPPARFARLKERRRALTGRTGCGLCGIESLDSAIRPLAPLPAGPGLSARAIAAAMAGLAAGQVLNRESHAVHAAAWAGLDGTIHLLREDVGRHNALDKLTGALARAGLDPLAGFLAVTSRCSYEIVHKAAQAGITAVAAVSAPTAYAVRLAEAANIALIAFARGERHTAFTGAARIAP
ncbi:formate dehydrogenase accessory sulfurtransferase FdhD [Zavarzinia compransoris]|uniref:Sulfur carrier protein FdhD n=1 Tax=Zavarzinia compransoris TaxID=1264899 RepID=A0A317E8J6_9PROT|nr:formate dehydrogenase accessory sulfurtransferase FdhD [Zavarzinia compransoris]PWR23199.1 formate dehydrogenase accessory sulfurtransferase FdhD [Zavarzinia compransoris]TDP46242.1 FdhD protein/phenylacetyl-CoA:acceptor oxidoreductase accessory protein [Zavarzinia compransoris]